MNLDAPTGTLPGFVSPVIFWHGGTVPIEWDVVDGDSEELIGKWFKRTRSSYSSLSRSQHITGALSGTGLRDKIFLATKFGLTFTHERTLSVSGAPDFIASQLATSLERLQTDHIDLYYVHRIDPKTPIETTMGALAKYVK